MTLSDHPGEGLGAGLAAAATTPPTKQASTGATSSAMKGMTTSRTRFDGQFDI
jgi:hypothetical protein